MSFFHTLKYIIFKIKVNHFYIISSGHFAIVRRCIEKTSRTEFAAKYIKKRRISSSRRGLPIEIILREVEVLKALGSHPNIISLHQVFDNGQNFILVLDL